VTKRTTTTIDETDASTSQAAYNAELRDALEKLRGEMDEQLRQSHDETEAFYERKVLYLHYVVWTASKNVPDFSYQNLIEINRCLCLPARLETTLLHSRKLEFSLV